MNKKKDITMKDLFPDIRIDEYNNGWWFIGVDIKTLRLKKRWYPKQQWNMAEAVCDWWQL